MYRGNVYARATDSYIIYEYIHYLSPFSRLRCESHCFFPQAFIIPIGARMYYHHALWTAQRANSFPKCA